MMIFRALDVSQNFIFIRRIIYKTHRNTRNRSEDWHAAIHKSQSGSADGGLRCGAVGSHGLGNNADSVRKIFRLGKNHKESFLRKGAVADFAPVGKAGAAHL